jgi:hypothetical protein
MCRRLRIAGADAWKIKCQARTSACAPLSSTVRRRKSSDSHRSRRLRTQEPTLALAHEGARSDSTAATTRLAPRPHQRQSSPVSASREAGNRHGCWKTWHRRSAGYTQQHSQELRPQEWLGNGSWNISLWLKRGSPVTGLTFLIFRDASRPQNRGARFSSSFAKPSSCISRHCANRDSLFRSRTRKAKW